MADTTTTTTALSHTLSNITTDQFRNFKFLVTFYPKGDNKGEYGTNFGKMGFVSVSGLTVTTESIAYREGGYNTNVHQLPGQSSFTPITLSKGITFGQKEHALWMKRLFALTTGQAGGGAGTNFRCDLEIKVLTHPNPGAWKGSDVGGTNSNGTWSGTVTNAWEQHTAMEFRVYNAWITSLGYSQLDAGGSTLMVEEMTLVHEGFDVSFATGLKQAESATDLQAIGGA